MSVVDFHKHSGFAVFDCEGCGYHVTSVAPVDRRAVCTNCRWLEAHPDAPQEVVDLLRGRRRDVVTTAPAGDKAENPR